MDSASIENSATDETQNKKTTNDNSIVIAMEDEEKGLGLDRSLEEMGGLLAERDEEISALRERLEELEMKIENSNQEKKELAKVVGNKYGGENEVRSLVFVVTTIKPSDLDSAERFQA